MSKDAIDVAALVPHAGAMCLLDSVVRWDTTTIDAIGTRHLTDAKHPLRSARGLHAIHLTEYGAQAMAVHGALLARQHGELKVRAGRLVSLRDIVLVDEYVDLSNGRLDVHAQCLYAEHAGAQYVFRVEQSGRVLATGRAAVIYADS